MEHHAEILTGRGRHQPAANWRNLVAVVWRQFVAVAVIGALFLLLALLRFRSVAAAFN